MKCPAKKIKDNAYTTIGNDILAVFSKGTNKSSNSLHIARKLRHKLPRGKNFYALCGMKSLWKFSDGTYAWV